MFAQEWVNAKLHGFLRVRFEDLSHWDADALRQVVLKISLVFFAMLWFSCYTLVLRMPRLSAVFLSLLYAVLFACVSCIAFYII